MLQCCKWTLCLIAGIATVLLCMRGAPPALGAPSVCEGELVRARGELTVAGCALRGVVARQVLNACSVGQQCRVTGELKHCRGVRGACGEIVKLGDARWGKTSPKCATSAAATRADEWWQDNSSVLVRGTIAERELTPGGVAPFGHTKIVMDLTTCSDGAPMAVDHVPDRWLGHYVEISGTAMKGSAGWYIIARDVRSAGDDR